MRNLKYLIFFLLYSFLSVKAIFKDLYLNTSVYLLTNGSANVVEVVTIYVNGSSMKDYNIAKKALNLTVADWKALTGSNFLMPHVFDKSYYNFYFSPEALISYGNFGIAKIRISYTIDNATTYNLIAPRLFKYSVNPKIFKFEAGKSGPVLSDNTSLSIFLPSGAIVENVFPMPDNQIPFEKNFTISYLVWNSGEPLSSFTLVFYIKQGMQTEIFEFIKNVQNTFIKFIFSLEGIVVLLLFALLVFVYYLSKKKKAK
jgi:hypothetical protein